MRTMLSLISSLVLSSVVWAQVPTHCPAFRTITASAIPAVRCNTAWVEITRAQLRRLASTKGAGNPAQYCTDGTVNAPAQALTVYTTASGYPEPCDFYHNHIGAEWADVQYVRVVYADFYEHEMDTNVTTILWEDGVVGGTALGFDPMPPDLTVGPTPEAVGLLPIVRRTVAARK